MALPTTTTQPTASFSLKGFLQRHQLVAYFVLAYAITWTIVSPLVASALGLLHLSIPPQIHYLGAYGPLLSALIVTGITSGAAGLRELGTRMLKLRVGIVWILIALFSPALLFSLSAVILRLTGTPWPDFSQFGRSEDFPTFGLIANWIIWTLTLGIGEETGWRGFALPRLQKNHSALTATLILTVFWAIWHVPAFFYRPQYLSFGVVGTIAFFLLLIPGAIFLTWLYNSTRGSILMVVLWHGAYNTATTSPIAQGNIAAVMSILIMVWALLIVIMAGPACLSRVGKQTIGASSTSGGSSMNWQKLYNPIVIWLLRSPMHSLMDKHTMLITVTGRKSGKFYTFPVSYIRDGETLQVISQRDRTWWKNLQGDADISPWLQVATLNTLKISHVLLRITSLFV
jgi:membrane protease YdiL (CAAX protease family)